MPKPTLKEKVEAERNEKFNQKKKLVKAVEKTFRGDKVTGGYIKNEPLNYMENGFIKNVGEVSDKMEINFTEQTTTIIVSPTHNILRVYDLLTDKQKESAEITGVDEKRLKFSW